jgi:hypothetical protein
MELESELTILTSKLHILSLKKEVMGGKGTMAAG